MKKIAFAAATFLLISGCVEETKIATQSAIPQTPKVVEGEALHTDPVINNSLPGLWEAHTITEIVSVGDNKKELPKKIRDDKTKTCITLEEMKVLKTMTLPEVLSLQPFNCSGKAINYNEHSGEFTLNCVPDEGLSAAAGLKSRVKGIFVSYPEETKLHITNEITSGGGKKTTVQITNTSKRLGECSAKDATIKATN